MLRQQERWKEAITEINTFNLLDGRLQVDCQTPQKLKFSNRTACKIRYINVLRKTRCFSHVNTLILCHLSLGGWVAPGYHSVMVALKMDFKLFIWWSPLIVRMRQEATPDYPSAPLGHSCSHIDSLKREILSSDHSDAWCIHMTTISQAHTRAHKLSCISGDNSSLSNNSTLRYSHRM